MGDLGPTPGGPTALAVPPTTRVAARGDVVVAVRVEVGWARPPGQLSETAFWAPRSENPIRRNWLQLGES
jgi:hypothetical protein